MQAVSTLIDFLMSLMRDDKTKAAFEQDAQGTLKAHGLDGITGADVRDARLIMADNGDVRASGQASGPGGSDPVREIHHTTRNYEVTEVTNVDQTFNVLNIDDRDTVINDSFNKGDVENNVVAIQDNDTTDIDVLDIDVTNPAGGGTESTPETPSGPESGPAVSGPSELPEDEPVLAEEPIAADPEPEPIVAEEPEDSVDDEPDLEAAVI